MRAFLLFLCYSFLGWVCESVYCSIGNKKLINRGFLNGPLCPVYGFGAMAVLLFLRPLRDNIPLLFLSGMLLTSVIEYITGFLLEKLFATKWWDYSGRKFNIHGRVCLRNSLLFGVLSVVAARVIDPIVRGGVYALPDTACMVLSALFAVLMLTDLVVTVRTILDMNGALKQLQQVVEQAKLDTAEYLRQNQQELRLKVEQVREETAERLRLGYEERQQKNEQYKEDFEIARAQLHKFIEEMRTERVERRELRRQEFFSKLTDEQRQAIEKLEEKMEQISRRNTVLRRRLLHAFPDMHSTRYNMAFERMREALHKKASKKRGDKSDKQNKE